MAQELIVYLRDLVDSVRSTTKRIEVADAREVFALCSKALTDDTLTEAQRALISKCRDMAYTAESTIAMYRACASYTGSNDLRIRKAEYKLFDDARTARHELHGIFTMVIGSF